MEDESKRMNSMDHKMLQEQQQKRKQKHRIQKQQIQSDNKMLNYCKYFYRPPCKSISIAVRNNPVVGKILP